MCNKGTNCRYRVKQFDEDYDDTGLYECSAITAGVYPVEACDEGKANFAKRHNCGNCHYGYGDANTSNCNICGERYGGRKVNGILCTGWQC